MALNDVEISAYAVDGTFLTFTVRELQSILFDWKFVCYLALAASAYTIFDSDRLLDYFSALTVFLVWAGIGCTYVVVLVVSGWLFSRKRPVYIPLASISSVCICTILTGAFLGFAEHTEMFSIWKALRAVPSNFLLVQIFEIIFIHYILPHHPIMLRRRFFPEPNVTVAIAGEWIDYTLIQHIKSDDHYVYVVLKKETKLLRAKFANVIIQLDNARGMQVHRSHWVAIDNISCFRNVNGRITLLLDNNTEVPVSRSFSKSVRVMLMSEKIAKTS